MTAFPQRATRDRFDAAPGGIRADVGVPAPSNHDYPRPGDVCYDVTARRVYRNRSSRTFPPLEPGNQRGSNESDPALVYAEELAARYGVRSFIIGLPPTNQRSPIVSEAERLKRARANDIARRAKLRILEYGDNSDAGAAAEDDEA